MEKTIKNFREIIIEPIKNATFFEKALLLNALLISYLKLVPIALTILIVSIIVGFYKKEQKITFKKSYFYILSLPFFISIIGFANTTNIPKAFEDLSRLLPYLIYPLCLMFFHVSKNIIRLSIFSYVLSLFLYFSSSLLISFFNFLIDYDLTNFFYSKFVEDTNSFSVFNMFVVLFLTDYYFKFNLTKKTKLLFWSIFLFFIVVQLLLQSRISIAITFLSILVIFIVNFRRVRRWELLLVFPFAFMLLMLPQFQGRFKAGVEETKLIQNKTGSSLDGESITQVEQLNCESSTSLRYNAILTSFELFKENSWFGVGSGDWRDALERKYVEKERFCNAKEITAPHNQFLRILLKFGLFGAIFFLGYFIWFFIEVFKYGGIGMLAFILTLFLSCLGYDVMDGGVSAPFVAYFSTLLFYKQSID